MAKPVIYKSKSVKDAKTKREVYDVTDTERTKIRAIIDTFNLISYQLIHKCEKHIDNCYTTLG